MKVREWMQRSRKPLKQGGRKTPEEQEERWRRGRAPVTLTCSQCAEEFVYHPVGGYRPKTCSERCRRRALREANRGKGTRGHGGTKEWRAAKRARCAKCGRGNREGGGPLHLHHVVYEQHAIREGGERFDVRNAMTLCNSCHRRHHLRTEPVHVVLVPDAAIAFAAEIMGGGAYNYFQRYYDGTDRRVESLRDLPAVRRA
jgi:5-methylcytosine-specific restriction endonuclease McrA